MKEEKILPQEIDAEEVVQELTATEEDKDANKEKASKEVDTPKSKDNSKETQGATAGSENEAEHHTLKEVLHEQAREDEEPMSNSFTLRKILGGDILSAEMMRSQIWLIIIIVLFVIVYISNRYSVQKNLLEIDKLNKELQDVKYKALSSSSQLTERSRESHVLELLKQNNDSTLKMPEQPPYIIEVPE